jgi:hypothetical protein
VTAPALAAKDFAVAPAPIWRLLWLWVPMLAVAALIVVTTLQSAQRTPHELGLTLPFLAVLTAVLSAAFFFQDFLSRSARATAIFRYAFLTVTLVWLGWIANAQLSVVNLMAPQLVVLGDLFTSLPPAVVEQVRKQVHARSLVSRAVGGTRIETSPLGRDAKLIGAAELAFEPVLSAV